MQGAFFDKVWLVVWLLCCRYYGFAGKGATSSWGRNPKHALLYDHWTTIICQTWFRTAVKKTGSCNDAALMWITADCYCRRPQCSLAWLLQSLFVCFNLVCVLFSRLIYTWYFEPISCNGIKDVNLHSPNSNMQMHEAMQCSVKMHEESWMFDIILY